MGPFLWTRSVFDRFHWLGMKLFLANRLKQRATASMITGQCQEFALCKSLMANVFLYFCCHQLRIRTAGSLRGPACGSLQRGGCPPISGNTEIQKYRNTFAIKLLHKAYNQHQGAHPTQKYRKIHSMTKLFSKHTTIVLNTLAVGGSF